MSQIGAKDMRCMFVYTVSSFSVNYACLCVYHQMRLGGGCKFESFAVAGGAAEPKTLIQRGRNTHILRLPPGRVVTFTKLYELHEHKSIEIRLNIPE